jgi:hypothetical protein
LRNLKSSNKILGVIFLFCLCIPVSLIYYEINSIENSIQKKNFPKSSDPLFNIIKPDSVTYTEPMSGYYLATYGFENDIDGNVPFGWTDASASGCGTQVISDLDGHYKVLECWDQSASGYSNIINSFSPQTSGTVEWWWQQSKSGVAGHVIIGGGPTLRWTITDLLQYDDSGGTPHNVKSVNPDQWYHHKIVFDCDTDTFDWYIDGILEVNDAEFRYSRPNLDYFRFYTWTTHQDYFFYLDAVGYSWDPNYYIDDNTQEGLLLSYETDETLDWVGYSLDGQSNQTILGNTTIPMPYDGSHSIQVFGNDSLGNIYQSNIRYFSVNFSCIINTPEDKTYTEPMDGYYLGTFGFENDKNWRVPFGWTNASAFGCGAQIISSLGGHNKVLECWDQSASGYSNIYNYFSPQTSGAVEWWWRQSGSGSGHVSIADGPILRWIYDGQLQYDDLGGISHNVKSVNPNQWYHHKIVFDCDTDTFDWYIDGILEVNDAEFRYSRSNLDYFRFYTWHDHTGYSFYIDAVGYSWDPNYSIGENTQQGLLLSFECNVGPNRTKYSLDGQSNQTIMGNTTIPMPDNGPHSIQVFANDSSGNIKKTNIRSFTIDLPINIITPESKTYTTPMSGYYPATFGFENDLDGTSPDGWTIDGTSILGGTANVLENLHGHRKIVELYDNNDGVGRDVRATKIFSSSAKYGDIELWLRTSNTTKGSIIEIGKSSSGSAFLLKIMGDNWTDNFDHTLQKLSGGYFDGPIEDTWYHLRISFETTKGGYESLDQWQWKIWIDGEESDIQNFVSNYSNLNQIRIKTEDLQKDYLIYFDAVAYSWDVNYNIGDNLNEGLLLTFKTDIDLNWMAYSIDGQNNVSIIGNITIQMPENGLHIITVFGRASGTTYQSNIRSFTIDLPIKIITPESKIYATPMNGYYPAIFGFENDLDGTNPSGWMIDGNPSIGGTAKVLELLGGHRKVVELYDNNDGIGRNVRATKTFDSSITYGDIEFWLRTNDTTKESIIEMRKSSSDYVFLLKIMEGNWKDNFDVTLQKISGGNMDTPSNNTWYHIRISFETTTGGYEGLSQWQWKIWVNGEESTAQNFVNNYSPLDQIRIRTRDIQKDYFTYFDAIGYSWNPNYNIGDNLNEGLLLNFENNTVLSWMGYSIDGQNNVSILGNVTFTMPYDGSHTIKVFGNDSMGDICHSNVRHFSVDTNPPKITINSPNQNEFFGIQAPNFDISIQEANLYYRWYTIDNGITNTTFSGLTGIIAQSEWSKKSDGAVTIKFSANDTGGYEGYAERIVRKDTNAPSSLLSFIPHNETYIVNKSTTFMLTADDGLGSGVSVIRYSINNSNWIDYDGLFNLSSFGYGYYYISYYSVDEVDNTEEENTLLVKLVEILDDGGNGGNGNGGNGGGIPPEFIFWVFIFIGIFAVATVITIIIGKKLSKG